MSPEQRIRDYIVKWTALLDTHLGRYVDPNGTKALVIGCGHGTEIFWLLKNGAASVVGCDSRPQPQDGLRLAVGELGGNGIDRFEVLPATSETMPDRGTFDIVVSFNVFEHVFDLSRNLSSLRRHMQKGSRFVLFTDPLFYSSQGSHLHLSPWEHLRVSQESLRAKASRNLYGEYRDGLNGMTVTTFLDAAREAGMVLLNMHVVPDRAIGQFYSEFASEIPPAIKPLDLCLEGFAAELTFPEYV